MSLKLDLKDKKLLYELDFNGRASLSELAKKLAISKQSVDYRINRLIKNNAISGFYAVLDLSRLGYMFTRFLIKLKDTNLEKEKEIIDYGISRKDVGWVITTEGKWDLVYVLYKNDINEIKKALLEINYKFGNHISEYEVSLATNIYHFQHKYILDKKEGKEFSFSEKMGNERIDLLDYQIIKLLANDARVSLTEIAQKLDTSYKVVGYRIKKLEEAKIILGYRASINQAALGKTHYKIWISLQNLSEKSLSEFKAYLRYQPNVIYITEAVGFADIEFEAIMDSHLDFNNLMKDIRYKFSDIIKSYDVLILLNFYEVSYLPEISV